jgi:hypothetical protein
MNAVFRIKTGISPRRTCPLLATICLWAISLSHAQAISVSGATYELVGFSDDGHVLTQQRNAQFGIVRFELLSLEDGKGVDSVYVSSNENPRDVLNQQIKSHNIRAAGFPGAVSPLGGAAVMVTPTELSSNGTGQFNIWLADGSGVSLVASLPLESQCAPDVPKPSAVFSIDWAPNGRTAVVTGHLNIESPCDAPKMVPIVVIVRSRQPATVLPRGRLKKILKTNLTQFHESYPLDCLPLIQQWLALIPNSIEARAILTDLRVRLGDTAGAYRALWSLVRRGAAGRIVATDLMLRRDIAVATTRNADFELLKPLLSFPRRIPAKANPKPKHALEIAWIPPRHEADTDSSIPTTKSAIPRADIQ